jgi:uncharacterized protein (DUF2336 family)
MGILHSHVITFTRDFCAQQRPNASQKAQLQDLLLAYQSRLSPDDLKTVCSLLASNDHAPKALILELCKRATGICHPLLLASRTLNTEDLIGIINSKGLTYARIIARRTNIDHILASHLRELNDSRVDRALELRQKPVQPSLGKPSAYSNIRLERVNVDLDAELLKLTEEDDVGFIHTALVDNLSLEFVSVRNLCSDFTSRNLPVALHYLRLSTQTAWQVFKRLAHGRSLKDDIREQFMQTYESLDFSTSVATVKSWQKDDLRAQEIYSRAANQTTTNSARKAAS